MSFQKLTPLYQKQPFITTCVSLQKTNASVLKAVPLSLSVCVYRKWVHGVGPHAPHAELVTAQRPNQPRTVQRDWTCAGGCEVGCMLALVCVCVFWCAQPHAPHAELVTAQRPNQPRAVQRDWTCAGGCEVKWLECLHLCVCCEIGRVLVGVKCAECLHLCVCVCVCFGVLRTVQRNSMCADWPRVG